MQLGSGNTQVLAPAPAPAPALPSSPCLTPEPAPFTRVSTRLYNTLHRRWFGLESEGGGKQEVDYFCGKLDNCDLYSLSALNCNIGESMSGPNHGSCYIHHLTLHRTVFF